MFVGDQARLGVGFAAARVSLGTLARVGLLAGVARLAYADGISGLHRAVTLNGPSGSPELVDVQARELVMHDEIATLALRWQAWDPAAGLFPALDANLTLVPGHPAALLTLAGAYRPPPGYAEAGLDPVIVHQAASATIASFLNRVADTHSDPDPDRI